MAQAAMYDERGTEPRDEGRNEKTTTTSTKPDPEILTLGGAGKYCGVSDTTLRKLVEAGLLHIEQVAPWAPWEIQRSDLEAEPVCSIIERVKKTGKLDLEGDRSDLQPTLFE